MELMQLTPGEDVPWVLKRFVGFLSKFGLEVRATNNGEHHGLPLVKRLHVVAKLRLFATFSTELSFVGTNCSHLYGACLQWLKS